MQYFIEAVVPIIFLIICVGAVTIFVCAVLLMKGSEAFAGYRANKLAITREQLITDKQREISLLYRDAVAGVIAEINAPNKTIVRETISPDVQNLLMQAHERREFLPALTREDRA